MRGRKFVAQEKEVWWRGWEREWEKRSLVGEKHCSCDCRKRSFPGEKRISFPFYTTRTWVGLWQDFSRILAASLSIQENLNSSSPSPDSAQTQRSGDRKRNTGNQRRREAAAVKEEEEKKNKRTTNTAQEKQHERDDGCKEETSYSTTDAMQDTGKLRKTNKNPATERMLHKRRTQHKKAYQESFAWWWRWRSRDDTTRSMKDQRKEEDLGEDKKDHTTE